MAGHAFARFSLVAVFWIGAVIAAPLAAEERSCLEHSLPDKLMAHFNSCMEEDTENTTKEAEESPARWGRQTSLGLKKGSAKGKSLKGRRPYFVRVRCESEQTISHSGTICV
ncbi:hypothetical protein TNIN_176291 [Trichonephila inaurata madagascariensis]|uniref:Uncharacterized protein n=1 Tax=Trichonephila inaurata madagascariensis TaxID=2747483 RepID=A0A8X6YRX3_9ARAC|nr:hypothetical protein TNIN_176291 [Trichonephila inaurata madagascariensis]